MLPRPSEAGTCVEVCEFPADEVNSALVCPVLSAAMHPPLYFLQSIHPPVPSEPNDVAVCQHI